jgi:acyl-CoA synthetase (AMP-forming)/AMP-acid ligase II
MANRCIADIVRKFAHETPENTAIKFADRRVSWRELDERATRTAAGLQAAGISNQQRVAFLAKNCLEYFTFGAAKLNAVVVAINWRLIQSM